MKLQLRVPLVHRIPEYQLIVPFWRLKLFMSMWRLEFGTSDTMTPQGLVFGWYFRAVTPWIMFYVSDFYPRYDMQEISSEITLAYRNVPLKQLQYGCAMKVLGRFVCNRVSLYE